MKGKLVVEDDREEGAVHVDVAAAVDGAPHPEPIRK